MGTNHLSIVVAFVAYSMLDLGKVVQKHGLATAGTNRRRGWLIWAAGSVSTMVSSLLLLYAVSLGSVVAVGAMAGTGLASVALFSATVLKERVGPRELAGVAAILAGPFFLLRVSSVAATQPIINHLFLLVAGVVCGYGLLVAALARHGRRIGFVVASAGGSLGGFTLIFQKVSTSEIGRASSFIVRRSPSHDGLIGQVLDVLANPYTLLWVALSILATLVLQLSYRDEAAIRVIPAFGVSYILIPVVGGLFFFREPSHPLQWIGIGLILLGAAVLFFSGRRQSNSA